MRSFSMKCTVFAVLFFSVLTDVFAGGPVHGAKAAGMGTAFAGLADDPSAILYNPAGLTQVEGTAVYGGISVVSLSTEYEDPSGRTEKTGSQLFFPPHLFLSTDLDRKNLRLGLGLYSPFGTGGRSWSNTSLNRYASTGNLIGTLSVNPTAAWLVAPGFSVAAGADYMRASIKMERMMDQSAAGAGDAESKMEADGHGWGYNFGFLLSPSSDLNIGFAYRSRVRVDYEGDITITNIAPALQSLFGGAAYSTGIRTTTKFPDIYSLGVAVKPSDRLVLDVDIELVRWSSFDSIYLDLDREVAAALTDGLALLDWKDSWQIKAGADYKIDESFSVRGGYAYIPSPVPDSTLEPGNPDADQHNISIGMGYKTGATTIDLFYNYTVFEKRTVSNLFTTGTYSNTAHYIGVSTDYRF